MLPLHPALLGQPDYLFSRIEAAAKTEAARRPDRPLLSLGIGDVTLPIAPVAAEAMRTAAAELASESGQRGYGPAAGYPFLQNAIASQYAELPCPVSPQEITVTAGSKDALGGLFSLFAPEVPVWVCDPAYPAYRAAAEAAGHPVFSLPCREEQDFLPQPEEVKKSGLIVLCTPNNPTGAVMTLTELERWVHFAEASGSMLLVDTAYAAFLTGSSLPAAFMPSPAHRAAPSRSAPSLNPTDLPVYAVVGSWCRWQPAAPPHGKNGWAVTVMGSVIPFSVPPKPHFPPPVCGSGSRRLPSTGRMQR